MIKGVATELTLKAFYRPAVKANADQLAEAGRIIWACTQKGKVLPEKYTNGDSFVKWATKTKGDVFKQGFFTKQYKLTKQGKEWIKGALANIGLEGNETLGRLITRTIRKFRGIS